MYSKWHWLHPAGWFLWVILTGYVIFVPFSISIADTPFELLDIVFYVAAVGLLISPIIFCNIRSLRISGLRLNRKYVYHAAVIYLILTGLRISTFTLDYEILRVGLSSGFFYLNIASWLIVLAMFTLPMVAKYRGIQWLMFTLEVVLLFNTGFREWIIAFFVGFIIVLASLGRRIHWSLFPIGILVFLFVLSPVWYAQRSASSYLHGLSETELATETRGKFYHTGRYFFNDYGYFFKSASARLGAPGEASIRIIRNIRTGEVDRKDVRTWSRNLNQIFVPRIFWPDKPSFRPGEEVYTTFYDQENPRQISHPSGIIGELWWLMSWYSFLILPAFGFFLMLLANAMLRTSISWPFVYFLLFFVFLETHIVFYLSGWLRVLPVYLIFWYLLKKNNLRNRI